MGIKNPFGGKGGGDNKKEDKNKDQEENLPEALKDTAVEGSTEKAAQLDEPKEPVEKIDTDIDTNIEQQAPPLDGDSAQKTEQVSNDKDAKPEEAVAEKTEIIEEKKKPDVARPKPGLSDMVAGETKDFVSHLTPHLPQDLVGGSVPHIPGSEEEAVWNAAAQACGTEKVNFCYVVEDKKVWYLAAPSVSFASNPDSWCPLAAALPGNSEFWDKETVYLYEQEGLASALRWDPETTRMQVFLGASRTILPRIQSMDANFVTINPEAADIIPWKNRNLKTEKLSRGLARILLFSALLIIFSAVGVLGYSYVSINAIERNMAQVKLETDSAAMDLMLKAANVMQSDTIKHMVCIQRILDGLAKVDGTLVRYEVNKGNLEWEAIVPQAFAEKFGRAQELIEKDGRLRVMGSKTYCR